MMKSVPLLSIIKHSCNSDSGSCETCRTRNPAKVSGWPVGVYHVNVSYTLYIGVKVLLSHSCYIHMYTDEFAFLCSLFAGMACA